MTQIIKYTNENRKVIVINDLNTTEKIVQEIFITKNGKEEPGGEKFVIKSAYLNDEPKISWKESEVQRIEEKYNKVYKETERKIEELENKYRTKSSIISNLVANFTSLEKNMKESDFETLVNVVSGKITHIVKVGYGGYTIEEFRKSVSTDDNRVDSSVRLLSLFGRSNGDLTYKLNRYSDGSGGYNDEIYLFTSYADGLEYVKTMINIGLDAVRKNKSIISTYTYNDCKKYKVEIPKDMLKDFFQQQLNEKQKKIDKTKSEYDIMLIEMDELKYNLNNNL